jgi:methionyl-tRNA formyltransferase
MKVMENKKVLHVFGGGVFVKYAVDIAKSVGWGVILRTGKRFLGGLEDYDKDDDVTVLVGNSLAALMDQGGVPGGDDIGISFSAPWVIPKKVIDLFHGHFYNLHNQPLPKFRGAGGSSWNILMGDREGGSSIHLLVPEIDAGSIFASVKYVFPHSLSYPKDFDDYSTKQAIVLLESWLPTLLKTGDPGSFVINDDEKSEYWPRLNAEIHGWINFSWSLEHIVSFCNAFSNPHKGAKTMLSEEVVYLSKVRVSDQGEKFHPFQTGLIYRKAQNTLYVAHPDGALIIDGYKLESEGRKIMLGDRLYTPVALLEGSLTQRIQYSPDGSVFRVK